jgi:hypothetical protein
MSPALFLDAKQPISSVQYCVISIAMNLTLTRLEFSTLPLWSSDHPSFKDGVINGNSSEA